MKTAYDLLAYHNPNGHSDVMLEEKQEEILLMICRKGVVFPTEISREVSLNMNEVNMILYNLHKLGFAEKIYPDPEYPQFQFRGRMIEFWKLDLRSFAAIAQYSWWTLTVPGIEYMLTKYKGKGKVIKGSLLLVYQEAQK